jgi:putative restriction endonuclease
MRGFLAPTEHAWWQFLLRRPDLREVNFWRPGAGNFVALRAGEPFFFKLKAPHNQIGGFGLFARFERLPVWQAWDVFGKANGASDVWDLARRLDRLGRAGVSGLDRLIGCRAIVEPTFFAPDEWVTTPADWSSNTVSGAGYDLSQGEGRRVWEACLERAAARTTAPEWTLDAWDRQRLGKPLVVVPRLGQGSFRLAVLEAYGRSCAVTSEHSLPVIEAAHILPWAAGGSHEVPNGLPLRRDLHRLFDLGFVTVRPDLRFAVSPQLRDDYANGRTYYELEGRKINTPGDAAARPSREALEWHGDTVFRAT